MEKDNTTTSTITLEQWKQSLQRGLEQAEAAFDVPPGTLRLEFVATSSSQFYLAYLALFTNVIEVPIDAFVELERKQKEQLQSYNMLENIHPICKFSFFCKAG